MILAMQYFLDIIGGVNMADNGYYVYVHVFPNGKKYFGITKNNPMRRWQNGAGYTKEQTPVYRAIHKYGWDNIQHIVLFSGLSLYDAQQKERDLIALHKTNVARYGTQYGYNATDGGEGVCGPRMHESKRGLKVICDGIEYSSVAQFARTMGLRRECVKSWLNGVRGMPSYWYDKGLRYKDIERNVFERKRPFLRKVMYDGIAYSSISELSKFIGVDFRKISWFLLHPEKMPDEYSQHGLSYADQ